MFNRTDGMQHDSKQRITDGGARTNDADTAPRSDGGTTPATGKAEAMIDLLANRIRRNENRR